MFRKRISHTTAVSEFASPNAGAVYWWTPTLMNAALAAIVGMAYAVY